YDFGEAFVALQEAVKPALGALVFDWLAGAAERAGDSVTAHALASLKEDAAWHDEWSRAFLALVGASEPGASAIPELRERWSLRAAKAVAPLRERLGGAAA